ncbi:MAG: DNA repair protein RecO [Candidatus Peribacteraceae bacterium]|nr:DNA repair protein RecO [Candidatus Peribacteraceae bacterium]
MAQTFSDEAIVLRAFDLGEADRLYVLLTAHHGRLAVRAGGARKPLSRLGGHLTVLSRVRIQWTETNAGLRLTSALAEPSPARGSPSAAAWCAASEAIELVLRLTEEDTPLPGLFELLRDYLEGAEWEARQPLFSAQLLHLLGHLPVEPGAIELKGLSMESQSLLLESLAGAPAREPEPNTIRELAALIGRIAEPLLARPLKAQAVRLSIAGEPGRHLVG